MKVLTSGMGLHSFRAGVPKYFLHQGMVSWKTVCPGIQVEDGLRNDSSAWLLLCTSFLLLLHQLHLDHQALDLGDWGPFCFRNTI